MITRSLYFEAGIRTIIQIDGQPEEYISEVEEVHEDTLVLAAPLKSGEVLKFEPGKKLTISVSKRMNPYFFDTTVVANREDGSRPTLVVRRPPDNTGVAKRQYIRVDVVIETQAWIEEDGKYGRPQRATMLNISAGGCQLMTKEALPEQKPILLKFTLPLKFGQIMVTGTTLRTWERVGEGGRSFRTSIQFTDLSEKDRDRVIKFVFERERELKRKGVL